jgi:hypothetical protein
VTHGRLRRWWWRRRLRKWERRLHRFRAKAEAWNSFSDPTPIRVTGIFVTSRWHVREALDKVIDRSIYKVTLYRNLLRESPPMKLIEGGKDRRSSNA